MMLQEILSLGRGLSKLLDFMSGCFASRAGGLLALVYACPPSRGRTSNPWRSAAAYLRELLMVNGKRIDVERHAADDVYGLIDETALSAGA